MQSNCAFSDHVITGCIEKGQLKEKPSDSCRALEENHLKVVETVPLELWLHSQCSNQVSISMLQHCTDPNKWGPISCMNHAVGNCPPVILPNFLNTQHLPELDAAEDEEVPALPQHTIIVQCKTKSGFYYEIQNLVQGFDFA